MKKIRRYISIILLILVILPILLSLFVIKPMLSKQIKSEIESLSKGIYSVNYEKMDINLFSYTVKLNQAEIIPDGSKLDQVKPTELYNLKANTIIFSFTDFYHWYQNKQINFNKIELDKPFLRIVRLPFKKSGKVLQFRDSINLQLFSSKKIEIKNGALIVYNFQKNQVEYSIQKINIKLDSLIIPTNFSTKQIQFKNIHANLKNLVLVNDSLRTTAIKNLKISQEHKIAEIDSLRISPRIGKYQLAKFYKKGLRWQSIFVKSLVFQNLDFESLKNNVLSAQKLYLEKARLEIFNDNNYPQDSTSKTYILTELAKNSINFRFDTIDIHNSNILIEKLAKHSRLPDQLHFSELSGYIADVWLSEDSMDEKTSMHANLKGYLQDVIPFEINSYPSHYPFNWKHKGDANVSVFKLKRFKNILKNNYDIIINDGECEALQFNFEVNNKELNGDFLFRYNNLDFDLINKKGQKSIVFSLIQKFGFYSKANPASEDNELRKAKVHYEVKNSDGLVDIWIHGMEIGVLETVHTNMRWSN